MSDWQPVGTHPHNTPMLIFDGKMICVAEFNTEYKHHFWTVVGASGYECEDDFETPTHWMPLPEPPKDSK